MSPLNEYRRKRHFDQTPEPPPKPVSKKAAKGDGTFVVQKHAARRLHYDFRLGIDGVLVSWAVPKGPSLNPADKRLAVQTEDHPMDYGGFEGSIPAGSYGAGTVMVWDRGTFSPEGPLSARQQLAKGEIKFSLQGEKLRGSFVLVKLKRSEKGNEWLMIKHNDAAVDPAWDIDRHDGSVLSGRTLPEIAEELPPHRNAAPVQSAEVPEARKTAMPSSVAPMLATLSDKPFSDPEWVYEIKWDGVRALAFISRGKLTLHSRLGKDITATYPDLAALPARLHADTAILDGEIVALDERGHSSFERLQERMHVRPPAPTLVSKVPATYYVFDLLYCDGYDLRGTPLVQRKEFLRRILNPDGFVRFSDHQPEHGKELFEAARKEGLEGIVAKRADSAYVGVRSSNWIKLKATKTADVVVGGWTAPRNSRAHFGSLLLGLYKNKKLQFVGHVGAGFNTETLASVATRLDKLETAKSPFQTPPQTNEKATWVKPELVAHVQFTGWTDEQRLRNPVFLGLRDDITPQDCRFENEIASAAAPPVPAQKTVHAPAITGEVLTRKPQIEAELFHGKRENVIIEIEGKRLRLSNLNKVYFRESGYTKRELLAYYYRMTDYILPFLKDRPLVLRRYPDGIKGQAFFQKNAKEAVPEWLETQAIHSEHVDQNVHYAIANDQASLLFLTGLGCIDHNPWSSRKDDPEHPDYFFFDLDPSDGTDFSVVMKVAKVLYRQLDELGMKVFLKTSGATGFHMYLPVERGYSYEQLRNFAEIVMRVAITGIPELVTHERTVTKRPRGRVLIDVQQNALGRPLAAPYAVRAFPKAPVSAPISPDEIRTSLKPEKFNIKTIFSRMEEVGDLWANFWQSRQKIEPAIDRLNKNLPK